jgi:hypothetical protein
MSSAWNASPIIAWPEEGHIPISGTLPKAYLYRRCSLISYPDAIRTQKKDKILFPSHLVGPPFRANVLLNPKPSQGKVILPRCWTNHRPSNVRVMSSYLAHPRPFLARFKIDDLVTREFRHREHSLGYMVDV